KRSIPPPFAPRAQPLMRMAEGRAGDPEAGPAPRGRSAAERPQEVPRLPGAIARVPGGSTHLVSEVLPERRRHPCPCWEECAAARPSRFALQRIRDPPLTRWPEPARTEGERKEASTAGEGWRPRPRAGRRSNDGLDGASDRPAFAIRRTPRMPAGSKRPRNP